MPGSRLSPPVLVPASIVAQVTHGANTNAARPANATVVLWEGSVAPTHALAGDLWLDTTNKQVKRSTGGGSFDTYGGGSGFTPVRAQLSHDVNNITSSVTRTEIHAADLTLAFVAPASGSVILRGQLQPKLPPTSSAQHDLNLSVDIVTSPGGVIVQAPGVGGYGFDTTTAGGDRRTLPFGQLITGLTPGQAHTAHLFWQVTTSLGANSWQLNAGSRGAVSAATWWQVEGV